MARNVARRASDGRRRESKRGLPAFDAIPLLFPLAEVPRIAPLPPTFEPRLVLIPGVLVLGQYNKLLDSFAVMYAGKIEHASRAQIARRLEVNVALRVTMESLYKTKMTPGNKQPEIIPLLPARCPSAKTSTVQAPFEAVAQAA